MCMCIACASEPPMATTRCPLKASRPSVECFKHGMMCNKLWKEGVKSALEFRGNDGLELAQSIPELDPRVIANIPGLPGNVCFVEGGRFRIPWVGNKGEPTGFIDAVDERLRVIRQSGKSRLALNTNRWFFCGSRS